MERLFEVIHEDAELLVVNKPAGLVCHPTKGDEFSSLISRFRLHLGPTTPPHLVNRLDRETSGVLLVAKKPEIAGELGKLWESRRVTKSYWAIVHGHTAKDSDIIDAPLGQDTNSIVAIKDCVRADGAAARTDWSAIKRFSRDGSSFTWLEVLPQTGRKHQIRIHLAHAGHPIVGDKLYGGDEDAYMALVEDRLTAEHRRRLILSNHALHARSVQYIWRGKDIAFTAEPEPAFTSFISGNPVSWPPVPAGLSQSNSR